MSLIYNLFFFFTQNLAQKNTQTALAPVFVGGPLAGAQPYVERDASGMIPQRIIVYITENCYISIH